MKKLFKHKVALVTGAASGIGKSTALLLAEQGAAVVVSDIHADAAQLVVDEIHKAGGKAVLNVANTANPEDARGSVQCAIEHFGALHLAVNNAGIKGTFAPIAELSIQDWQQVIDVNLNGVFYGLHYQLPAILAAGGGAIVNLSSILGLLAIPNSSAYTAAKHAVAGLTKTAALEYSSQGVRVNSIHPGYIETPILEGIDLQEAAKLHPIGRIGKPEEVADLISFLLSEHASFITGAQYTIDGGYTSQ